MAEMQDVALDWDVCEADPDDGQHGGWTLLPEGFYPFRVERMERERYQGSQKMPQCPMAKLTLSVTGADGRDTTVQQRLYITRNQLWKVSRFMEAVGRGRNGAGKVIIDWGGIEGTGGFVKLKVRSYTGRDGQPRCETILVAEGFSFCGPPPQAQPRQPAAPPEFLAHDGPWLEYALAPFQATNKLAALRRHHSQFQAAAPCLAARGKVLCRRYA